LQLIIHQTSNLVSNPPVAQCACKWCSALVSKAVAALHDPPWIETSIDHGVKAVLWTGTSQAMATLCNGGALWQNIGARGTF